ncbi:PfkB family carbohydrate kinase [Sedimentitalea sp. XS_ASV28]|uniref:PfkB family carbohydrate kinase n=1 Tax=Sedimentitalea sp. XS_ASV28 TaxID=3241296 RepID=UPI0035124A24
MSCLLQMSAPVVDSIYTLSAFPVRGKEVAVTGHEMAAGGGLNAMVAARQAQIEVRLGGSLGSGPLAGMVAAALKRHGIDCARPPLEGLDQGLCTVLVEPDGERSFITHTGAETHLAEASLAGIALEDVDWVMLSGYSLREGPDGAALAGWIAALPARIRVLFDPSPIVAELPQSHLAAVLGRADWISANADEAQELHPSADAAACALSLAEARSGVVLRQGAEGCLLATGGNVTAIPAHRVVPLDTNGAGDAHIGSFIAELARSGDPLRAARYANIAAALAITRKGPATAPARAEVEVLLTDPVG